jgi:hypothetical protein
MRLKRQVGRSPIIALCAAASVTLPAMFSVPIARADNSDDPLNALMMGGTTMPTPSIEWQDRIVTDYIGLIGPLGGLYTS